MTAAPRLPGAFQLVALDRVDSTNEEARRLAETGAPAGTVVWALSQTAGRGRRERVWRSPAGNLYFSLLLRPIVPAVRAMQCSFIAANAVADAVQAVLPEPQRVACKWPNDVLIGGRKVAGILLEAAAGEGGRLSWMVIGIGVNIADHPRDTEFPATSLAAEGGAGVNAPGMLERIMSGLDEGLEAWAEEGFAPVRKAWLARAFGLGERIRVRLEKETLEGIFAALEPDGTLVLREAGGERRIAAGDVFVL